jgi:ParB/RepB/Spo0J family partition protein
MAVAFDTPITRGVTEWKALPEELEVHPELNGRHDLPDITELVQSILTVGQLQPVTIRRSEGRPVLVAGYTRWRAVDHINKNKLTPEALTLRCSYTQLTDKQAFLANIHENRVRNATTAMDDAYNLQKLINVFQMDEKGAADCYRASVAWVRDRLALLEATPELEKAIREKRVAPSAAKAIAKLSKEQQKRVVAKPGKVTAADVKREVPTPEKVAKFDLKALKAACLMVLAEADTDPDAELKQIHRDTIKALRIAMGGE